MKKIALYFILATCWLPINLSLAQVNSTASDFMAAPAYKAVYNDYVSDLSSKIFSGEVEVYTDPSLINLLPTEDRGEFLTEIYVVDDFDPYGEVLILEVRDTLRGPNWQGIHFGLTYISIKVNEFKFLYLPNKEKSKLNKQQNSLLEKLQSEAELELIGFESIEKQAHLVYNALQKRIFDGIQAGKLPVYRVDSVDIRMSPAYFDTSFDIIHEVWEDGWEDDFVQYVRSEFVAGDVSGSCVRTSIRETSDGWHLEFSHYGITHNPQLAGFELSPQPMCWIKREDLQAFLNSDDWLFLQELWGFTLQQKLRVPLNSTNF